MGGGGGGSDVAGGATQAFGQAIGTVGTSLTDYSGKLQQEQEFAQNVENPYTLQMLQQAFDPQQALYNRTLQQVSDQTRSGEAARGVANTPYGAAAEGNALSNFNIDWQNQQLNNQIAGLGASSGVFGGLAQQGATAALPSEAALQAYTSAYSTSAQAQTAQNQLNQSADQFGASQLAGIGGSIGSLIGKGG